MDSVTVKRFRAVPPTATALVNEGDHVTPDTPVAKVEVLPGKLWRHDIARELCDGPEDVPGLILKKPGQRVAKGEVLAAGGDFFERRAARSQTTGVLALVSRHLGFAYVREELEVGPDDGPVTIDVTRRLGCTPPEIMLWKTAEANTGAIVVKGQLLASRPDSYTSIFSAWRPQPKRETRITSPIYGKITAISPLNGTITITPLFKSPRIHAYIGGTVTRVSLEGVEITTQAQVLHGMWGLGGESWGPVQVLDGDLTGESPLREESVIVSPGTVTFEGLQAAQEKRSRGVVLGYLPSETAVRFGSGIKNMGITGDEDVPFPLVLIQGFLPERMNQETLSALRRAEGSVVSLCGVTHIRAGVIRPEIIVPAGDGWRDGA